MNKIECLWEIVKPQEIFFLTCDDFFCWKNKKTWFKELEWIQLVNAIGADIIMIDFLRFKDIMDKKKVEDYLELTYR